MENALTQTASQEVEMPSGVVFSRLHWHHVRSLGCRVCFSLTDTAVNGLVLLEVDDVRPTGGFVDSRFASFSVLVAWMDTLTRGLPGLRGREGYPAGPPPKWWVLVGQRWIPLCSVSVHGMFPLGTVQIQHYMFLARCFP